MNYPLDSWAENGHVERTEAGLLTYDNMLPAPPGEAAGLRLLAAGRHHGGPNVGGDAIAEQAHLLARRVIVGDVNPNAIAFDCTHA